MRGHARIIKYRKNSPCAKCNIRHTCILADRISDLTTCQYTDQEPTMHQACKTCEFSHECTMGGFMADTVTVDDCPARLTLLASKKTGHKLHPVPEKIDYRFNEGDLIAQFKEYVDGTYREHYSSKDVQTFELIRKTPERAFGFLDGNIIKYADRDKGQQRKDYLKIMHYALLALNELERPSDNTTSSSS